MDLAQISAYFTKETLEEIVKKAGGDKLTGWSFGSGFKKGDSYLSEVFRLKVEGVNKDGSPVDVKLIVKSMPKNMNRRKLFRSADFFRNEIVFYTEVLPAFEAFQKEQNCPNPFREYPKRLAFHCDGKDDFIALEDVGVYGCKPSTRQQGIDLAHCEIIMRTLGRFHAVSLALKNQDPEKFKELASSLEETYFSEKYRSWYAGFLAKAINVANDSVSKEYPHYEARTKAFTENELYTTLMKAVTARTEYSVLGHGDCWPPNFLMRYNEEAADGVPLGVTIIDFQLARLGSPALDLSFFTYSCLGHELREQYYDYLLKVYHTSACDLIKNLGCNPQKVFPFEGLQNELKSYAKFGLGMSMEAVPLAIMDESDLADLDLIDKENADLTDVWKIRPIQDQEGRLRLASTFKHAADHEYI